ncbi:unnamed protein product [Arctogadus glacialis]
MQRPLSWEQGMLFECSKDRARTRSWRGAVSSGSSSACCRQKCVRLSSSLSEVRGGLDRTVALDNTASQPEEGVARGTPAPGEAPARPSEAAPEQNGRVPEEEGGPGTPRRGPRARRHANHAAGRSHVHLMRVGCVLGTCQVQNLSHRLHQLIGRRGREDSSPINPRSPHSYG